MRHLEILLKESLKYLQIIPLSHLDIFHPSQNTYLSKIIAGEMHHVNF